MDEVKQTPPVSPVYVKPTPPASTGTWGESVETRLAFVESVVRAGHAVGQEPGTARTPPAPEGQGPKGSAADYAKNPPPTPPVLPIPSKDTTKPTPARGTTYDNGTTYGIGDVATVNGVRYKSLANGNVGHAPNASSGYWQPV